MQAEDREDRSVLSLLLRLGDRHVPHTTFCFSRLREPRRGRRLGHAARASAAAVECTPAGALGGGSEDNGVTSNTTCGDDATTQNMANQSAQFEQASAYGSGATAIATQATAIGSTAQATGLGATAIGFDAIAQSGNDIAIGNATASGGNGIAIGNTANDTGASVVAIGFNDLAGGANAVSLGPVARSNSARTTIADTGVTVGTSADSSSAFGDSASVADGASDSLALGASATVGANHTDAAAFGAGACRHQHQHLHHEWHDVCGKHRRARNLSLI